METLESHEYDFDGLTVKAFIRQRSGSAQPRIEVNIYNKKLGYTQETFTVIDDPNQSRCRYNKRKNADKPLTEALVVVEEKLGFKCDNYSLYPDVDESKDAVRRELQDIDRRLKALQDVDYFGDDPAGDTLVELRGRMRFLTFIVDALMTTGANTFTGYINKEDVDVAAMSTSMEFEPGDEDVANEFMAKMNAIAKGVDFMVSDERTDPRWNRE